MSSLFLLILLSTLDEASKHARCDNRLTLSETKPFLGTVLRRIAEGTDRCVSGVIACLAGRMDRFVGVGACIIGDETGIIRDGHYTAGVMTLFAEKDCCAVMGKVCLAGEAISPEGNEDCCAEEETCESIISAGREAL